MNTNTLRKAIEELSKVTPDISYVRGMLETLLEVHASEITIRGPVSVGTDGSKPVHFNGGYQGIPVTGLGGMAYQEVETPSSPEGMAVEAALSALGSVQPKVGSLTIEKNISLN